jgi:hypothetical protein
MFQFGNRLDCPAASQLSGYSASLRENLSFLLEDKSIKDYKAVLPTKFQKLGECVLPFALRRPYGTASLSNSLPLSTRSTAVSWV